VLLSLCLCLNGMFAAILQVKRRKVDAEVALNDMQKQLATHKQTKVYIHFICHTILHDKLA
jgi:uncharacterized OsmC-like protein